MARHEFAWVREDLVYRVAGRLDRYVGAVRCARCGLQAPCRTEEHGRVVLADMRAAAEREADDGECDLLVVEKVLAT